MNSLGIPPDFYALAHDLIVGLLKHDLPKVKDCLRRADKEYRGARANGEGEAAPWQVLLEFSHLANELLWKLESGRELHTELEQTPIFARIIRYIDNNRTNQSELAGALHLDCGNLSRYLDAMESKGLIHRERTGRSVTALPTPLAQRLLSEHGTYCSAPKRCPVLFHAEEAEQMISPAQVVTIQPELYAALAHLQEVTARTMAALPVSEAPAARVNAQPEAAATPPAFQSK